MSRDPPSPVIRTGKSAPRRSWRGRFECAHRDREHEQLLSMRCCLLSVESPSMRTGTSRSSHVAATLTTRHHGPLLVFISLASKVADVETHSTAFHCQILHSCTPTRTIVSPPSPPVPYLDAPSETCHCQSGASV